MESWKAERAAQSARRRIRAELQRRGLPPDPQECGSSDLPSPAQALQHSLWLCDTIREHVEMGELDEAYNALGFVQGILWAMRCADLHLLRSDLEG